jgi:hypothetical protein
MIAFVKPLPFSIAREGFNLTSESTKQPDGSWSYSLQMTCPNPHEPLISVDGGPCASFEDAENEMRDFFERVRIGYYRDLNESAKLDFTPPLPL